MGQKYSAGSGLRSKPDGTRETLEEAETRVGRRRVGWIAGAVVSAFIAVGGAAGCADNADMSRNTTWFKPAGSGADASSNNLTVSDTMKSAKQFGFGLLLLSGALGAVAFGVAASRDREKLDVIKDNIRYRDEHKAWKLSGKAGELASPSNDK